MVLVSTCQGLTDHSWSWSHRECCRAKRNPQANLDVAPVIGFTRENTNALIYTQKKGQCLCFCFPCSRIWDFLLPPVFIFLMVGRQKTSIQRLCCIIHRLCASFPSSYLTNILPSVLKRQTTMNYVFGSCTSKRQ